jgi:hypothetical protein
LLDLGATTLMHWSKSKKEHVDRSWLLAIMTMRKNCRAMRHNNEKAFEMNRWDRTNSNGYCQSSKFEKSISVMDWTKKVTMKQNLKIE